MIDAVAAVGDAGDVNCWSGIPWHFGQAAREMGEVAIPWRLNLALFVARRRWWNLAQLAKARRIGGYQYSQAFLDHAEAGIPKSHWTGRIVTFNQHFPRTRSVLGRGARLAHYVDATFASFCTLGGLAERLPARVRQAGCALERENYEQSERVVTMARWAADSVVRDCGVSPNKVFTLLPGANLALPEDYEFSTPAEEPGTSRPLVLGFVGKDWIRKGLPFLLEVRNQLERMGVQAVIRCAGNCPSTLRRARGLEYVGFIDKASVPLQFVKFLAGCDVGCLFSRREPLGISTLEFLRAGVPAAGFAVEGVADTLPPDAGFRFEPGTSAEEVAARIWESFREVGTRNELRNNARAWSPLVTWQRCVTEWKELLHTGTVRFPIRPWLGLRGNASRKEQSE
jgi:glycosyltransferase involved in cell wall biosynthesis